MFRLRKINILIGLFVLIIMSSFTGSDLQSQVVTASFDIADQDCNVVTFNNTSSATGGLTITGYLWEFDDGNTSTDKDPVHTYSVEGDFNVKLTVYHDGPGQEEVINPVSYWEPVVSFNASIVCFGEQTQLSSTSSSPSSTSVVSWDWDLDNDGAFDDASGEIVNYVFPSAGTLTVGLKVLNSIGCQDFVYQEIQVRQLPVAEFIADTVCYGIATQFTNNSTAPEGFITEYRWDFDNDGTFDSNEQEPSYIFPDPGVKPVTLEIETNHGCIDSFSDDVRIWELPEASYSYDPVCPLEEMQFTDESSIGAAPLASWEWNFDDGSLPEIVQNPVHTFQENGEYNVSLYIVDENGCDDDTVQAIQQQKPDAGYLAEENCLGLPTVFTDTSLFEEGFDIISWMWDFGDGFNSTDQNPTHTYANFGEFDVELIVQNTLNCYDTTIRPILVDTLPVANFIFDVACEGEPTCFTDFSIANADTIVSWEWDFGDGNSSTLYNPCHIYTNQGSYEVSLVVINSDGCISEAFVDTVTVSKNPEVDFTYEAVCYGDTTYFENLTDTFGYQIQYLEWNFGDITSGNNTSGDFNAKHLFSTPGVFDVKLIVQNEYGCIDSIIQPVIIDSLPEAKFWIPDTISVNVQFFIQDSSVSHGSPILTRLWDFGDGQTAMNINPVFHTYESTGKFEICLDVEDFNGCNSSFCDSITVVGPPVANFNYASDVTLETYFYDASTPEEWIINWFWDFGDPLLVNDTISGIPDPVWQYDEEGWYEVSLTVFDKYGGSQTIVKMVYAGNAVVANFEQFGQCLNDTTFFIDNSSSPISAQFEEWFWDFGDGNTMTYYEPKDTVQHHYAGPGNYSVKYVISTTVNGFYMQDSLEKVVSIYEYPTARIDTNGLGVCLGTEIDFQDATIANVDPISSWLWDFDTGNGDTSVLKNPSFLYADTGSYNVTMRIVSENGCESTDTVVAYVSLSPDFSFTWENNCLNSPTKFIPLYDSTKITITSWFWDFGDNLDTANTSTESNPTHVYDMIATYDVTMKMESYSCPGEKTKTILVYPIPYSNFDYVSSVGDVQGKVKFTNNSIYSTTYLWDFGNGNTSSVAEPIEVYEQDSTYTVTLVSYNEYHCSDTSRAEIQILFRGLYFPTAFSPNNPNSEIAHFTPKGINLSSYLVQVFDMRGNLLWESDKLDANGTPTEKWDGYYEGKLMPQGMYIWKAEGVFKDGTVWQGQAFDEAMPKTNGTVTLIR